MSYIHIVNQLKTNATCDKIQYVSQNITHAKNRMISNVITKLKAGGERDGRGWDGWMVSQTQRTWVGASSGR